MKPELLWQSYVWSPGICWRCSAVTWVAACGTTHSATTETTAVLECCAPCLIAADQIHRARVEWQRRGVSPKTPAELTAYYAPAARSTELTDQLHDWLTSLLVQLDAQTVAALVFGVRGHVVIPETS